jgi:recombination protein RecA
MGRGWKPLHGGKTAASFLSKPKTHQIGWIWTGVSFEGLSNEGVNNEGVSDDKNKLDTTVAALQDRWGSKAIQRLAQFQSVSVPCISTGFPALDDALTIGGLPGGRICEIVGVPTSGMATIAFRIISQAQVQSGTAIFIDLGQNFDPVYAANCGLDLNQLVLVRPQDAFQALVILQDFIAGGGISVLVFDIDLDLFNEPRLAKSLATTLDRIISPLSRTECVLLFLTSIPPSSAPSAADYPRSFILPHYSAVRLFIRRERWLYKQGDIRGYQANVQVAKNKLGPAGKEANLSIQFDETSTTKSHNNSSTPEGDGS